MDAMVAVNTPRDDAAERLRFESFTLGKGLPSSLASKRHSFHARSHSRNGSVSSTASFPLSTSSNSLASSVSAGDRSSLTLSTSVSGGSLATSKRNSHHRRRSSVSTRHESAEMMGVNVPDLPPSNSDDNFNLGEKDSIRRRALWALEGKADVAYSKVEIPELSTPDLEKKLFDFSLKPSSNFGSTTNSLMNSGKRDSFKLLSTSSSSKDQLHTLVEEEEEEEEEKRPEPFQEHTPPPESPDVPASVPSVAVTKPSPARPRPTTLNLRPLSLNPESLVSIGLPTPSMSPGPRPALKSLALISSFLPSPTEESHPHSTAVKRQSLIITPSPTPPRRVSPNTCESPASIHSSGQEEDAKIRRRSSIGYRSSSSSSSSIVPGLPTPEHTPIGDRRYSIASTSSEESSLSRPLSVSEQHFLFKQHNALLARITDLERALSSRNRNSSRPVSCASDASSGYGSDTRAHSPSMSLASVNEPNDEMLRLISDLKGERDELKRDVDGWRQRVGDLEKQIGVFAKRVDNERREAWVARSRVGLLEVEKSALEKSLSSRTLEMEQTLESCDGLKAELRSLREERAALQAESSQLRQAALRAAELERECASLRSQLGEEKNRREELERELEKAELLATPTPRSFESCAVPSMSRKRGLGFTSIDSESSMTDVESVDERPRDFPLKAVQEADEDDCYSEEENGLAGYEDEEDSDISFQSPGGSSIGSEDEFPVRSTAHLLSVDVNSLSTLESTSTSGSNTPTASSRSISPLPPQVDQNGHSCHASLSKTWTFPRVSPGSRKACEDVDRFFGCLEECDQASPEETEYSYERSRSLFTQGLQEDEEMPPFLLPSDVGVVVDSLLPVPSLGVVVEEDEDDQDEDNSFDEEPFGTAGGITITFTPAEDDCAEQVDSFTSEASEPECLIDIEPPKVFVDEEDESDTSLSSQSGPCTPVSVQTPRKSNIPRPKSPSSFSSPRVVSPTSDTSLDISMVIFNESDFDSMSSPPRVTLPRFGQAGSIKRSPSDFATPPSKRGAMPSFIPQSVSSPSPIRSSGLPVKFKVTTAGSVATFTRQPVRKPLLASNKVETQVSGPLNGGNENGSTFKPPIVSLKYMPMSLVDCRFSNTIAAYPKTVNTKAPKVLTGNYSTSSSINVPSVEPLSTLMPTPIVSRLSSTFTSLNPFSWSRSFTVTSSTGTDLPTAAGPSGSVSDASARTSDQRPAGCRPYVSRKQQLEKLRRRLAYEVSARPTCEDCSGDVVYL